jgi:hypothetical protein
MIFLLLRELTAFVGAGHLKMGVPLALSEATFVLKVATCGSMDLCQVRTLDA